MPTADVDALERIEVVQGDITRLEVDVIVNAANSSLLGGGGVDGAIHRAAGPALVDECRILGGCKTGQAVMTGAHRLRARHIIHTVGPVWQGGGHGEAELLASCYRNSLALAEGVGARTIAFPMISTGIYAYPLDRAARVAVTTIREHIDGSEQPELIILCTFDAPATAAVRDALENAAQPELPSTELHSLDLSCPYCGEPTEITLDEQGGTSVEDCTVCCRPIDIAVSYDKDGSPSVRGRRQDG
ncbi:MAG TPA: O-acetyl-ADP-ribose deacetylase [Kofleriaceae bacterium]|nr:O-acetyl-ADP-ribose deacetylase [Kofleriaceae bacterium]